MTKVSSYHSSNPSDPDVYHDHSDCPTGQHCEIDCHPCDAPDPKTPCDSFTCQSTCVPD